MVSNEFWETIDPLFILSSTPPLGRSGTHSSTTLV
jgi:hypothetical protein